MIQPTIQPTTAEQKVIDAAAAGFVADFMTGEESQDDASEGASWGQERAVRGELLYALCAGLNPDWKVSPRGVHIRGAKITGSLDLGALTITHPLSLLDCWFQHPLILTDARTRTLSLSGSHVPGVEANRVSVEGMAYFDKGFTSAGEVNLIDATLGGSVTFDGARLMNPGGRAIRGPRLSVGGAFSLSDGFTADGEIELTDAAVSGTLAFEGATLSNPRGKTIAGDRLDVGGSLYLGSAFSSDGEISLVTAKVGGVLVVGGGKQNAERGAKLRNDGGYALIALLINVAGSVALSDDLCAEGTVSLSLAKIGSTLECDHASFKAGGRPCLEAYELSTGSSVKLGPEFKSEGAVIFSSARVSGQMTLEGAELAATGRPAFEAKGISVKQAFGLQEGTSVEGGVDITGAVIDGVFDCWKATVRNPGGYAISAGFITVKSGVSFHDFVCAGAVVLLGARIDGLLTCEGLTYEGPAADSISFNAAGLRVQGPFIWSGGKGDLEGVDLMSAHVGVLHDTLESWPAGKQTFIDNLTYDSFGKPMISLEDRLAWLRRQREFSLQPYEQAAGVLRRMGYEKEARRIAQAKQDDLREFGRLSLSARVWNRILGFTLGHGYQLWRVLVFAAIVVALGTLVFDEAFKSQVMQPVKDRPQSYQAGQRCPENVLCFEPLVYSADLFLPIIDLNQESYWMPVGAAPRSALYRAYYWFHILMGWVLTTLGVAGLTGLVKKD